jgi:hypothetical protein
MGNGPIRGRISTNRQSHPPIKESHSKRETLCLEGLTDIHKLWDQLQEICDYGQKYNRTFSMNLVHTQKKSYASQNLYSKHIWPQKFQVGNCGRVHT